MFAWAYKQNNHINVSKVRWKINRKEMLWWILFDDAIIDCFCWCVLRQTFCLFPYISSVFVTSAPNISIILYNSVFTGFFYSQVQIFPKQYHRGTLYDRGMSRTFRSIALSIKLRTELDLSNCDFLMLQFENLVESDEVRSSFFLPACSPCVCSGFH